MVAVAKLLRVLQAAPGEAHHGRLRVIEGGALVVKAGGADGVLYHVELLQLQKQNKTTKLQARLEAVSESWRSHPPDERGRWSASEPAADRRRSPQKYCPPQECAAGGGGGEVRHRRAAF